MQKGKEVADGQLSRLNAEHDQLCASKEELQKAHDELQANAGKLQAQACAHAPALLSMLDLRFDITPPPAQQHPPAICSEGNTDLAHEAWFMLCMITH